MPYFVEISTVSPATSGVTSFRFARGFGWAPPDAAYIPGGLIKWGSVTQKVAMGSDGMVSITSGQGVLVISNLPDRFDQAGPLDPYVDSGWQGRTASLYYVPDGGTYASRVLVDSAVLEQPVTNMVVDGSIQNDLTFVLRDPRVVLDRNLQTTRFAGTNPSGGLGVEGTAADLGGKPKPICYGSVMNIPGVRVSQQYNIYMLGDKFVTPTDVRDGGVSLGAQADLTGNFSGFFSTTVSPGNYILYRDVTNGSFVRLGSSPTYAVGIDCYEGTNLSDRSHAKLWSRLNSEHIGRTLDPSSVSAAHTADSAEAGFWWSDDITARGAFDAMLKSFGGYEYLSTAGLWTLGKLTAPTGSPTPKVSLEILTTASRLRATTRKLITVQRVRPDWTQNGAPAYRVTLDYGKNYSVMAAASFAGSASQPLHDLYGVEFRTVVNSNTAVWNPATSAGPFPNAQDLTVQTGYAYSSSGTSGATTEAGRLLSLYSTLMGQYQVSFRPQVWPTPDRILPGDVVQMSIANYGLGGGKLFRVLQAGVLLDEKDIVMTLVIGLQT